MSGGVIIHIDELLKLTVKKGASDLHLKEGSVPIMRIDGVLVKPEELPVLSGSKLNGIFDTIASRQQREEFTENLELDFNYSLDDLGRFRVSALRQRGTLSLAFRVVPFNVPSLDELGMPPIYKELALKPRGLVVVTGPTGSGKSTTLAAMLRHLNETETRIVITIENPIEYLHTDNQCVIHQRSIGDDTKSFHKALVHALRHDPDVIVLGEMRDLNTITTAITAAETGHLVLGTLHTTDAAQTIDRMVDVFPSNQQQQIRLQLSQVLNAVLSQILLPRIDGGRVAASEIMVATPAIKNVLREGQAFKIPNIIQMGRKDGMQTLDQCLADMVKQQVVSQADALMRSSNPEQLGNMLLNPSGANNNAAYPRIDNWTTPAPAGQKVPVKQT